ncbi:MAG: hypothetical protein ACXWLP_00115 [Myxococcaceae bacterium]
MRWALFTAAFLAATPAWSWDSRCTVDGAEGPLAAQNRWIDQQSRDEHRQIWLETLRLSGARPDLDADFTLASYTAGGTTLKPVSFLAATSTRFRIRAASEFTQLPDFSYSLWDWALGNETCPIDTSLDPTACHSFALHMGSVNSNHFPPQTATHYAWYHQLALSRATACKTVRDQLRGRSDLQAFVTDCMNEALVIEAIAHHFLQDSWSMGHMWQRWGSPNITDFANGQQALAVAALSGLIHGARAVLQPDPPTTIDVNDTLCAPSPLTGFAGPGGQVQAVGDLYLPNLLAASSSTYLEQYGGMLGCAVGSVREVLAAAGEPLSAADPTISPIVPSSSTAACFGRRATNATLSIGFAIDFKDTLGNQQSIPLDQLGPGITLIGSSGGALTTLLAASIGFEILKVAVPIRLQAIANPRGTDIAEGGFGDFLGIHPNAAYNGLGSYVDPALPWPSATSAPDSHELALARQFHRAHANDWCDRFRVGDPEFDLTDLANRARGTSGTACDVCVEFTERHLRIGDEATYDPGISQEPLCGLIASHPASVQYVYQPDPTGLASRRDLAARACGCGVTVQVRPKIVTLAPRATAQFTATVQGSAVTTVTWTATRGTIDGNGFFTAPATDGPVKVRASSTADPSAFDEAAVTVGTALTDTWTGAIGVWSVVVPLTIDASQLSGSYSSPSSDQFGGAPSGALSGTVTAGSPGQFDLTLDQATRGGCACHGTFTGQVNVDATHIQGNVSGSDDCTGGGDPFGLHVCFAPLPAGVLSVGGEYTSGGEVSGPSVYQLGTTLFITHFGQLVQSAGYQVTLTGTSFSGVGGSRFNGSVCSLVTDPTRTITGTIDGTSLTATVTGPEGTEVFSGTLFNPAGCP